MAATMAGRFCKTINHLILNFRQLNCSRAQSLVSPPRFFSQSSFFNVDSKSSTSTPPTIQKPKYPANVFVMYLNKLAPVLQKENPELARKDIIAKVAAMWHDLDPEIKMKLALERKELMEKYHEDMKFYLDNITPEQVSEIEARNVKNAERKRKLEKRNFGAPKKALGAFSIFLSEKFKERSDEPRKVYFSSLIEVWKNMSAEEKEPYKKIAEKNTAEYLQKVTQWEKDMMAMGRFDLVRKSTLHKMTQKKRTIKTKGDKPKTTSTTDDRPSM